MTTRAMRTRWLTLSAVLIGSKLIQWALDSQPRLTVDSIAFVVNAEAAAFPERSYLYGWLIRFVALPFGSFRPLVALQMLAGAAVAGILVLVLVRHAKVRLGIAILAALFFVWDPIQVVYEHLVMTECLAGLVAALFLLVALEHLRDGRMGWLPALGLIGAVLVGFRLVYVPLVYVSGTLLPLVSRARVPSTRRRATAVLIGVGAAVAGQIGYQQLTGWVFGREPAYHYRTGFFMVGNVAPLVIPEDAADAAAAAAIVAQQQSDHPLSDADSTSRNLQLWLPDGLVDRLKRAYGQDVERANHEAREIALTAIRRDPIGFLQLGAAGWRHYPILLEEPFSSVASIEDGSSTVVQPTENDWTFLKYRFTDPNPSNAIEVTPSRRYHQSARYWYWMEYLSPLIGLAAWLSGPRGTRQAPAWLAGWSALLIAATCLTSPVTLRYLHPLSFTGIAALAILLDRLLKVGVASRPAQRSSR